METSPIHVVMLLFHLLSLFDLVNCQIKLAGRLESHPIDKRQGFQGGWALQASTCSPGEVVCPQPFGACCPAGTVCNSNSLDGDTACCPDSNLCNSYVTNAPSCANSSWTLWDGGNNPFCCLGDQIGVNPNAVSFAVGACVANNVVLPASKSATSLVQVGVQTGTVPGATNTAGGSAAPTGSNGASASHTGSASTSGSSPASGSTSTSKSKISTGAIGGIAAAAVVVCIGLIALVGCVCYRMGGRRNQSRADYPVLPVQQNPMEYSQRQVDQKVVTTELPAGYSRAELGG